TNAGTNVSLHVMATQSGLAGTSATVSASVAAAGATAAALPVGVVNAASQAQAGSGLVTPGMIVSVYGAGVLDGNPAAAASIPLPGTLGDTQLFLGDQTLPLYYSSAGQVNALIPQSLHSNASYQLVVARGTTRSVPIPITIAKYNPGVFSMNSSG